jgi:hypothetical protein
MQETLRLELLKLVNRHDLSPEQIIERAVKLEAYVAGEPEQVEKPVRGRKATTVNPLD